MDVFVLEKSPRAQKKWRVTTPEGKKVDFGASGYSDYTLHKDTSRQENYIARHRPRENWTKSGTNTAGFWSRWILWNLPDLMESIKDTEKRFGIKIKLEGKDGEGYQGQNYQGQNYQKQERSNLTLMRNKELVLFCDEHPTNKDCNSDDFWYEQLTKRYSKEYGYDKLVNNKPYDRSWKEYFRWITEYNSIDLV